MCKIGRNADRDYDEYAMLGPVLCGVKRSWAEMSGVSDERQAILNISMCKLQSCAIQRRNEPSLHRSVLIYNTLKQIQLQLKQEGLNVLNAGQPTLPPSQLWSTTDQQLLDPPPVAEHSTVCSGPAERLITPLPSPQICNKVDISTNEKHLTEDESDDDKDDYEDEEYDDETGVTDNVHQNALKSYNFPSTANAINSTIERLSLPNLSALSSTSSKLSLFNDSSDMLSTNLTTVNLDDVLQLNNSVSVGAFTSPTFSFSSSAMNTSPAADSSPSITPLSTACTMSITQLPSFSHSFGSGSMDQNSELDLSVYDFDLMCPLSTPPLLPPSPVTATKTASLSAEELMHSLPIEPLGSLSPSPNRLKHDVLSDDLDHIMQILVGI